MDVSDIFYFFLFRGAGEGGGVRGGGRGGLFFIKIEGGGGVPGEEAREGEGRRGNVCGEGGARYFFSAPKCPPRDVENPKSQIH